MPSEAIVPTEAVLKIATWDDLPDIMDMAQDFHEASPYKDLPFDGSKVYETVSGFLDGNRRDNIILLAYSQEANRSIGMLAAVTTELFCNRDRVASEVLWWVSPEYRSGRAALELLKAYEYWAKNVAGCQVIQSATLHMENSDRISRVYQRKGFNPCEHVFYKVI